MFCVVWVMLFGKLILIYGELVMLVMLNEWLFLSSRLCMVFLCGMFVWLLLM